MWIFPSPSIGGVEIASWIEFLDQLWANRTLCYVEVKCFCVPWEKLVGLSFSTNFGLNTLYA